MCDCSCNIYMYMCTWFVEYLGLLLSNSPHFLQQNHVWVSSWIWRLGIYSPSQLRRDTALPTQGAKLYSAHVSSGSRRFPLNVHPSDFLRSSMMLSEALSLYIQYGTEFDGRCFIILPHGFFDDFPYLGRLFCSSATACSSSMEHVASHVK